MKMDLVFCDKSRCNPVISCSTNANALGFSFCRGGFANIIDFINDEDRKNNIITMIGNKRIENGNFYFYYQCFHIV